MGSLKLFQQENSFVLRCSFSTHGVNGGLQKSYPDWNYQSTNKKEIDTLLYNFIEVSS